MMGAAAVATGRSATPAPRAEIRAYLGTYTAGTTSEGLYHCLFDPATGALRIEGVTTRVRNPSFLALHPDGKTLYVVEEVDDRGRNQSGGVVAYAVDPTSGGLRERSYPNGTRVYVADLGLDRIATYGRADTGGLTPLPDASLSLRPGDGPRHMAFHPQAGFAYVINELSSTITFLYVEPTSGVLHVSGIV